MGPPNRRSPKRTSPKRQPSEWNNYVKAHYRQVESELKRMNLGLSPEEFRDFVVRNLASDFELEKRQKARTPSPPPRRRRRSLSRSPSRSPETTARMLRRLLLQM